jgi:hypothetical protein
MKMKRALMAGRSAMVAPGAARRQLKRVIPIMGCVCWLAACSSNHDAPAAATPPAATPDPSAAVTQLQADVASGVLPTLDLSASVTGTDSDQNGIRDDIDALIAKQTDLPVQRAALSQLAQSIQATLSIDPSAAGAAASAALGLRKAIACLFSQYDGPTAAGRFHWMQEVSINTMARLQAYDHFNIAMNNSATPMATGTVCNAS